MLSWLKRLGMLHIQILAVSETVNCQHQGSPSGDLSAPRRQAAPHLGRRRSERRSQSHGPRGGFAAQQRRRRRRPRRLSAASLTTATTAQHHEKSSPPTAGESRDPQATFAIDSSYVNNYGGRRAAGGAGEGRMGAVRHTPGPPTGGKTPARPSKWRRQ